MYQIDVLDRGHIAVMGVLGTDMTPIHAARLSYAAEAGEAITDKDRKLMRYLLKHAHLSPFRHVYVQLRLKMPDVVGRHLWKHTVGAGYTDMPWNEKSGRYKGYDEFYLPDEWRKQSEDSKQGSAGPLEDQHSVAMIYADHIKDTVSVYEELVKAGVAKEQARMVLPFATYTEVVYTASLQALLHLVKLRDAPDAQWETQQYAKAIKQILEELFPEIMLAITETGNPF